MIMFSYFLYINIIIRFTLKYRKYIFVYNFHTTYVNYRENSIVAKNPVSDIMEMGKFKGIPQSTSANSISSAVSFTDLALVVQLDKQNFSNVVNRDTAKATELYNKKADELAKAKSELAKYKKVNKFLLLSNQKSRNLFSLFFITIKPYCISLKNIIIYK